jgi:hypothetical protein
MDEADAVIMKWETKGRGIEAWDKADEPDREHRRPFGPKGPMPGLFKDFAGKLPEGISKVIQSMMGAVSKNANVGFSGIADVQKQVQMQAFQSRIAQETLDVDKDILNAVMPLKDLLRDNRPMPAIGP